MRSIRAYSMYWILASVIGLVSICTVCVGQTPSPEFRGVWADAFHPGFKTPAQTTEMVDSIADANMNAVFVQVRKRGDAYYNSSIVEKASDIASDYDPLADVIKKAHARGIQVHAWLNVLDVAQSASAPVSARHVTVQHPEWIMRETACLSTKQSKKAHLDPSIPEVKAYLGEIVSEIVSKYDVDGIHIEGARCEPFGTMCSDAGVAAFEAATSTHDQAYAGDPVWKQWNRDVITALVRSLRENAKSARSSLLFSIAAGTPPTSARNANLEDWEAWCKEDLLDFVVPMLYQKDINVDEAIADCTHSAGGQPLVIGIGAHVLPADSCVERIGNVRVASGTAGVAIFSYSYASRGNPSLLATLRDKAFEQRVSRPSWCETNSDK